MALPLTNFLRGDIKTGYSGPTVSYTGKPEEPVTMRVYNANSDSVGRDWMVQPPVYDGQRIPVNVKTDKFGGQRRFGINYGGRGPGLGFRTITDPFMRNVNIGANAPIPGTGARVRADALFNSGKSWQC